MDRHDITSVDSRVAVYVSDKEVYLSYPQVVQHTHLWKQDEPGAPIACVICGAHYIETKPVDVLRKEIWGRIRDGLRSPTYGYA